jgi:ABC-type uncharacterized transport system ATPase subunit
MAWPWWRRSGPFRRRRAAADLVSETRLPHPPERGSAALLEVREVVVAFGGVRALDGVDLVLAAGKMVAVIGPNGCGKTTLFNVVTGVLRPDTGHVHFDGLPIHGLSPHRIARAGILRKFQVPSVFAGLTVRENLRVAASATSAHLHSPGALIDLAGLRGREEEDAGALSHGEMQWLELAMVLAGAPRLVLLDEPAAGMTRAEKSRTADMLAEIRRSTGVALIVIEHDMAFVEALDCPVHVMIAGRIVATGRLDEVRLDPVVQDGYLGRRTVVAVHG